MKINMGWEQHMAQRDMEKWRHVAAPAPNHMKYNSGELCEHFSLVLLLYKGDIKTDQRSFLQDLMRYQM